MSASLKSQTIKDSNFVCDCEERMRSACTSETFYKKHEGKRYCVLHFPGDEKTPDFEIALHNKLETRDYDFGGVWFPQKDFTSKSEIVVGPGSTPSVWLSTNHLPSATFGDNANFREAIFSGMANFRGVSFLGTANFGQAIFNDEACFSGATFNAGTAFDGATFNSQAHFREATFKRNAVFWGATFNSLGNFCFANFNWVAEFSGTTFKTSADFHGATFEGRANFKDATFNAGKYPSEDTSGANFGEVFFHDDANFGGATFKGNANFSEATFKDYVRFAGSEAGAVFVKLASLNLAFARIDKPERVSFHTVTLRPHWFINIEARKFDFTNVEWNWSSIREEVNSLRSNYVSAPHRLLARACRHLAVNAEENHRYEEASSFRYRTMDAIRREHWYGFVALWTLSWWYWFASGYGERAWQAARVLVGLWLLFACMFLIGQRDGQWWRPSPPGPSASTIANAEKPRDEPPKLHDFREATIYSLGVIMLQKPEPLPANKRAKAFVLLEMILEPVQAALLALAIRRKFMH